MNNEGRKTVEEALDTLTEQGKMKEEAEKLILETVAGPRPQVNPDLMGKQKIAQLEDRITDQVQVINRLNGQYVELRNAVQAMLTTWHNLDDEDQEGFICGIDEAIQPLDVLLNRQGQE